MICGKYLKELGLQVSGVERVAFNALRLPATSFSALGAMRSTSVKKYLDGLSEQWDKALIK